MALTFCSLLTGAAVFSDDEPISGFGRKKDDLPLIVRGGGEGNFLNFSTRLTQFLLTMEPFLQENY